MNVITTRLTIVSAVYNVAPFLRQFIRSILRQDLGFRDNIQLILVDDGSTDGSGTICDCYSRRYPKNILVIHQKNQRQAMARKNGLAHAVSPVVNFCDPDDWLSSNACRLALQLLEEHPECDIASIPIRQFGFTKSNHPLNRKFTKGTRIINLHENWSFIQNNLATAFIRLSALSVFDADTVLTLSEDEKEVVKILLRNPRIGVVSEATYHYRKRLDGTVASHRGDYKVILEKQRHLVDWAVEYSRRLIGRVPRFIQAELLYAMVPAFSMVPEGALSKHETDELLADVRKIGTSFDVEVIAQHPHLSAPVKVEILVRKTQCPPAWTLQPTGITAIVAGEHLVGEYCLYKISGLSVKSDGIHIDGIFYAPFHGANEFSLEAAVEGTATKAILGEYLQSNLPSAVEPYQCRPAGFIIPTDIHKETSFIFQIRLNGGGTTPIPVVYNTQAPLTEKTRTAYYMENKVLFCSNPPHGFYTRPVTFFRLLAAEFRYDAWLLLKQSSLRTKVRIPIRWLTLLVQAFKR